MSFTYEKDLTEIMKTKKLKEIFIYKLLLSSLGTVFSLYTASTMSKIINSALDEKSNPLMTGILWFLLISLSFIAVKQIFAYYSAKREALAKQDLKIDLYRSFYFLSPGDLYRNRDTGNVLECFRDDFNTVTDLYCSTIPSMVISGVSYFIFLLYAGTKSITACLIMFFLSQLQLIVPLVISPKYYENYAEGREWEAKCTNVEIEAHTAFRDINIFNLQNWYAGYLKKYQKGVANISKRIEYLCGAGTLFEELVSSVIKYGTYVIIGVLVLYEKVPVDSAVLLLMLSGNIYSSLLDVYQNIVYISESRMAGKRLKIIMETKINPNASCKLSAGGKLLPPCKVISDGKTILDVGAINIHPDIPNVFIGENGSGKSTLLKVLAGFIVPDNFCEEQMPTDSIANTIFLPQEDLLLQENALELIDENERESFISLCCESLGLNEEKLTQSIRSLSGGERKKVYLALSFLRRTNGFLLLDEPTNHLDTKSKRALVHILEEEPEKTILVSHDSEFLRLLEQSCDVSITKLEKPETGS